MNPSEYDLQLATALGDDVDSPWEDGLIYSAVNRQAAALQSCKAYTRHRNALRRFGTGYTYGSCGPSSTPLSMLVTGGGGFLPHSTLIVDLNTPTQETVQIKSTALYTGPGFNSQSLPTSPEAGSTVSNLLLVNFYPPGLTMDHGDSSFVTLPVPGLSIVQGQDTYQLPYDWIQVEHSTFDIAIGQKLAYKAQNGFYDATYILAAQLTGLGMGYSATYGVGSPYGYAIAGNPYDNPNGAPGSGNFLAPGWRFYNGNFPKMVVYPIPSGPSVLAFDYFASHSISTVPATDEDAILSYGEYWCLKMRLNKMMVGDQWQDRKIAQAEYSSTKNMSQIQKAMAMARREFDLKIRWSPVIVSG